MSTLSQHLIPSGQKRYLAMSCTAHVHSHCHVLFLSVKLNKSPTPVITAGPASKGEPQHRGPTPRRQDVISTKATWGDSTAPKMETVSLDWVIFSSDTAVLHWIYKAQVVLNVSSVSEIPPPFILYRKSSSCCQYIYILGICTSILFTLLLFCYCYFAD